MENSVYLFCLAYNYNHNIKRDYKLTAYLRSYTDLLYGEDCCIQRGKDFKQVFHRFGEEALRIEQENIDYAIKMNERKKVVLFKMIETKTKK